MIKFLQFADDSTLIVQDEESINHAFIIIERFSQFSGLQLNRNKTEAIWLGCWKFRQREFENIKWSLYHNNRLKVLGIYIQNDKQIHEIPDNWDIGITKCQNIIKNWANRNLSIIGRIIVAKSFLLPQFLYVMQATVLSDNIFKKNLLLFSYIWSKKEHDINPHRVKVTERVKRNIMIQAYENQGLNIIDIECMQKSMAISWVKRLNTEGNGSWRLIPNYYYSLLSPKLTIFKCNTTTDKFKGLNQYIPEVYKRILKIWLSVSNSNTELNVENSSQVLWNNKIFIYRQTNLFLPRWIKKGITFVSDGMENHQISYPKVLAFIQDSGITKFEFNSVYAALKPLENINIYQNKDYNIHLYNKNIEKLTNQYIRKKLQTAKVEDLPNKWEHTFVNPGNGIFTEMFSLMPKHSKETKLILLQWKILHKIYPCNKYLHQVKLSESEMCIDCNSVDTFRTLFWECTIIKRLWSEVEQDMHRLLKTRVKLQKIEAMLGYIGAKNNEIINKLIIIAKQSIHTYRYGENTRNLLDTYKYEKRIRNITNEPQ